MHVLYKVLLREYISKKDSPRPLQQLLQEDSVQCIEDNLMIGANSRQSPWKPIVPAWAVYSNTAWLCDVMPIVIYSAMSIYLVFS